MQVRFVHDLGDDLHATVFDPESLHERLERAVVAVMTELRPEDVERDTFARSVRSVGELEVRLWIVKPLDQPRRRDSVDVRPRPGHPGASAWRQRSATSAA